MLRRGRRITLRADVTLPDSAPHMYSLRTVLSQTHEVKEWARQQV
jgi:hypothetical protein